MDENDVMMKELETLCKQIITDKHNMSRSVDILDGQKEQRIEHRKKILLGEMKQILAKLGGIEEILINELKADAFSKIQEVSRIFEEANALQFAMKNKPMPKEQLQKAVQALQESFQALDLDFFSKSIALEVKTGPTEVTQMRDNYCDAVFYGSNILNPKRFMIEGQSLSPNSSYLELSIICPDAEVMRHNFTLEKIKIIVSDPKAGVTLERTTAMEKITKRQASLSVSQGISKLTLKIKRHSISTLVSVSMFGTNITHSPVGVPPAVPGTNILPLSLNASLSTSMLDATVVNYAPDPHKDIEGMLNVGKVLLLCKILY